MATIAVTIQITPTQMTQEPDAVIPDLWSIKIVDSNNSLVSIYIGRNPYTTSYMIPGSYVTRAARVTDENVVVGPVLEVEFDVTEQNLFSVVEVNSNPNLNYKKLQYDKC